jgi:hypothetical protein
MATANNSNADLEKVSENLVSFSVDRDDLNRFMTMLPEEEGINRVTVEYEIPLLKIVSVGWAIAFFMENRPEKQGLLESYWKAIEAFSQGLSEVTNLTTGADINYFHMLKDRADTYVQALNMQPDAKDPAAVIGPTFAVICNAPDNIHVIMTGNRVFNAAIIGVKEYLAHINFA